MSNYDNISLIPGLFDLHLDITFFLFTFLFDWVIIGADCQLHTRTSSSSLRWTEVVLKRLITANPAYSPVNIDI